MKFINSLTKPKHLLYSLNSTAGYATIMSKPKVFFAINGCPPIAIEMLRERFVGQYYDIFTYFCIVCI